MVRHEERHSRSSVRIYVEGGGDTRRQQTELREGFARLFRRCLGEFPQPKVIACGGRVHALQDFQHAVRSHPDAMCLLLVDAEAPIREGIRPWLHVRERQGDGWGQPVGVDDEQLFFMVQAMEAWLVCDPEALQTFYGQGFRASELPARPEIEAITKRDLRAVLEKATRGTKKGTYTKAHGFCLIGEIEPAKLRARSAHAERFFVNLERAAGKADPPSIQPVAIRTEDGPASHRS